MQSRRVLPLVAMLATVITGCGDDPYEPTVDEVVGSYVLTDLVTTSGTTEPRDLIAEGVTAGITLLADGTTTGSLFIPGSVNTGGVEVNADLAGTWSLRGDKITFEFDVEPDPNDPLWLGLVEWTYSEGQITVDAGWIFAVLDRQ